MHNLSDYELMLLVKEKRQEALSILYDRHAGLVYSFAVRSVRNEQAARDVVQSVFIRLWTTESGYNPEKGRFTSWLVTITRNIATDWLRKERRINEGVTSFVPEQFDQIPDDGVSPEASAERESLKRQIRAAYRFLSRQQIDLLEHFYWQGYTLKELSLHYREPLGTVKNRLHQTLKVLRRHLIVEGEG
ncbi:RNA polymerase [Paenibacillus yonginensis]|uniref:RNA polymerase n=1 Tax=Paenibacillus yonginensis TaxID=1462996 RepID=A0A1B1N2H4_9BACL|nr:sigma-70 family RNA polymerase sigma factor [Paenibacillus yonginensis]ANS75619.1 RNA polymerase [Paenibacillus yonginensis]